MARNCAITIGINEYSYLRPLNYAVRDADSMNRFFTSEMGFHRLYHFTDRSLPIVQDYGPVQDSKPTGSTLRRFLRTRFDAPFLQDGDNLWFFFAGHGVRHEGRDYLMPIDADPDDLEQSAIPIQYISQRLRRSGADNIILLVDACRSDEGRRDGIGIGKERQQGVITLFSCSPEESSYEIQELEQGAFTYMLLDSLRIQGEGNCATVERLHQRLRHHVPRITQRYRRVVQTPYGVIEPLSKNHLILLPRQATLDDVGVLKKDALTAEVQRKPEAARQLWIRVLAVSPADSEAIEGIERILGASSRPTSLAKTLSISRGISPNSLAKKLSLQKILDTLPIVRKRKDGGLGTDREQTSYRAIAIQVVRSPTFAGICFVLLTMVSVWQIQKSLPRQDLPILSSESSSQEVPDRELPSSIRETEGTRTALQRAKDGIFRSSSTPSAESSFPLPENVESGTEIVIHNKTLSMSRINSALKQAFETTFAGTQVLVEDSGNSSLAAVLRGDADLAAISRPLTKSEKELGFIAVPIAREKIAVIVGKDNPFDESITAQQFSQIFRGEIVDWAEIGGSAGSIRFVDRPEDSDVRKSLQPYPVFTEAPFATGGTADSVGIDRTREVIDNLGADGIGYVPISFLIDNDLVKAIKLHQLLPADPGYPFSQPYNYVYAEKASPAAAAFLGFVLSPERKSLIDEALRNGYEEPEGFEDILEMQEEQHQRRLLENEELKEAAADRRLGERN